MDYVVELVPDAKTNRKAEKNYSGVFPVSFEDALGLLKDFMSVNGGQVKGWFNYDGERIVGSAVINATEKTADLLEQFNVNLLRSDHEQPFVRRIIGECFDITPRKDIKIFKNDPKGAECTI